MFLGCIGDDFTGSSDLANTLAKQGMRTVQYTGIPSEPAAGDVEAGVVALKSRSIPVSDAVEQSLAALDWLREQGCEQFFFKYCSTFDSTAEGNIGPVADALAEALDAHKVIVCPAFPGAGRSVYQGHLFVNDVLLNESGMQDHPLTPMLDSDIRRWLKPQTKFSVGHVSAVDVLAGEAAIAVALERENSAGNRMVVVDALRDEDLMEIGEAAQELSLLTGGSGVAMGLPRNFKRANKLSGDSYAWRGENGLCVVLSGSCSNATRAQVATHAVSDFTFKINVSEIIESAITVSSIANKCIACEGLPLVFSSSDPEEVSKVQQQFGRQNASDVLEKFFAELALELIRLGVSRLIVAGGETSGAVVEALELRTLEVGPEIDPGVPVLRASPSLVLALKSGNFGTPDFFSKAARILSVNCLASD